MDTTTLCRLALIYAHLMLCVFALQAVLHTDLQVLRGSMDPTRLLFTHRRLVWLLGGLWVSGLGVAAIDLGYDLSLLGERPKLMVKLGSVAFLTLNGLLLRHWCFPRLAAGRRLKAAEHSALLSIGAFSTTSWLMAAFFGIARPLQRWSIWELLSLYGGALGVALVTAVMLGVILRRRTLLAARTVRDRSARAERQEGAMRKAAHPVDASRNCSVASVPAWTGAGTLVRSAAGGGRGRSIPIPMSPSAHPPEQER